MGMDVTIVTWVIALTAAVLILLLGVLQSVAVLRPRAEWTIENVYGGDPDSTDPCAYFAHNQGWAWADVFLWLPVQLAASVGMVLGERWGFLLGLVAAVPFVYTAVPIFVWDRDMAFRENTVRYWVVIWGMWPTFGIIQGVYCFVRLLD